MFFYKKDKNHARKTILTAPLDWGLGHATRCIPIIKELNGAGHNVIIAADGPVKLLLQQEFPHNLFIPLQGYKVIYSKKSFLLSFKLLLQLPRITIRVFKEHFWLKRIVKEHQVNMIISDNRFGLYHSIIPSVYITHQLFIKTGNYFSEWMAQRIHSWFIKKYKECWIPDFEKGANAAGLLSHPKKVLTNTRYIGCLSRFEKQSNIKEEFDLLVLISGPEPQRTIFENCLLKQLDHYEGKVLFVRGLPGSNDYKEKPLPFYTTPDIIFKDHLPANELSHAIQQAAMVICRSGYTTIMDMIKLDHRAILIPTPGQAEQEYLADYLCKQNIFYSVFQNDFNLAVAIKKAEKFPYKFLSADMNLYKKTIYEFLEKL
jgi:uncharacterized protein (TIGR00661 family)